MKFTGSTGSNMPGMASLPNFTPTSTTPCTTPLEESLETSRSSSFSNANEICRSGSSSPSRSHQRASTLPMQNNQHLKSIHHFNHPLDFPCTPAAFQAEKLPRLKLPKALPVPRPSKMAPAVGEDNRVELDGLRSHPSRPQTAEIASNAESQVLEALTRLRSSSMGPTSEMRNNSNNHLMGNRTSNGRSGSSGSSGSMEIDSTHGGANAKTVTVKQESGDMTGVKIYDRSPIACFGLVESNTNPNNDKTSTGTGAGSACKEIIKWGCGTRFSSVKDLRSHLDNVSNVCIVPFTEWCLKNGAGPPRRSVDGKEEEDTNATVKSWEVVERAVENCLYSNKHLLLTPSVSAASISTSFVNYPPLVSPVPSSSWSSLQQPSPYWCTVLSKKQHGNVEEGDKKISISDLVEATMKIEQAEKERSRTGTATGVLAKGEEENAEENESESGSVSEGESKDGGWKRGRVQKQGEKGRIPAKRARKFVSKDLETGDETKAHKRSKIFKCPSCEKEFTRKSNLDSHLITHSNARPHTCKECGKSFARLSDRTRHESTTHRTTKTFQCRGVKKDGVKEWGCGHFYSRADGLRKHFKSFAGRQCLYDFLRDRDGDTEELFIAFRCKEKNKDSSRELHDKDTPQNDDSKPCKDQPETLQRVEAAIRNVRAHCGW